MLTTTAVGRERTQTCLSADPAGQSTLWGTARIACCHRGTEIELAHQNTPGQRSQRPNHHYLSCMRRKRLCPPPGDVPRILFLYPGHRRLPTVLLGSICSHGAQRTRRDFDPVAPAARKLVPPPRPHGARSRRRWVRWRRWCPTLWRWRRRRVARQRCDAARCGARGAGEPRRRRAAPVRVGRSGQPVRSARRSRTGRRGRRRTQTCTRSPSASPRSRRCAIGPAYSATAPVGWSARSTNRALATRVRGFSLENASRAPGAAQQMLWPRSSSRC